MYNAWKKVAAVVIFLHNLRAHKLRYSNSSARRYTRFTFATTLDGSNLLLPAFYWLPRACVRVCVLLGAARPRWLRRDGVRCAPPRITPMLKFGPVYFSFTCIKKLSLAGSTLQRLSSSTSTLLCGVWTRAASFIMALKNKLLLAHIIKCICESKIFVKIYIVALFRRINLFFNLYCKRVAPNSDDYIIL